MNATEYSDLKEKLHSPIRMARDVVIKQSLSDRFLDAFKKQVDQNEVYVKPPDMVRRHLPILSVSHNLIILLYFIASVNTLAYSVHKYRHVCLCTHVCKALICLQSL